MTASRGIKNSPEIILDPVFDFSSMIFAYGDECSQRIAAKALEVISKKSFTKNVKIYAYAKDIVNLSFSHFKKVVVRKYKEYWGIKDYSLVFELTFRAGETYFYGEFHNTLIDRIKKIQSSTERAKPVNEKPAGVRKPWK